MSEEAAGADKSHDPTPKKLEDARKKGDHPKSADLTIAAAYGGYYLGLTALGAGLALAAVNQLGGLLYHADGLATDAFSAPAHVVLRPLLSITSLAVLPLITVPAMLALLSLFAQRALVFAPSKLVPKLSRISPLAVAKQKFGLAGIIEFLKSAAKLLLYTGALAWFLSTNFDEIAATPAMPARSVLVFMGQMLAAMLLIALVISLVLGVLDAVWQQIRHLRDNRMSRQEVMDEMKESEGDPHTRQQRRQRGIAIAMNQVAAEVPKASVIIVNPTHYAVALQWQPDSRRAPVCLAKGIDEVALRMRQIAQEHGVPIQSDPLTARALYAQTEVGQEISRQHYAAVAAAIRFADDMRRRAARG
ncbi:EscU/YscU/HrcU family type III secretion system export apparatus switch protein [Ketogulonicigenium vulgare]|uniref:Flagellar biosynthetic protein FlhB n=1 Tax=Ketogulonicigenium vulgare (strain WSH-001) TaxID=759362 RepID=F9Y4G6_KETVW|nr:flagellar type III secretion system protein FlhB [Ketogulonicigenium vulgare]ADO43500.1 flagellar biosynthetic protein FlhB [Ketogulonicigenium vulgare Y25]AEM41779.1 Flagellar biosynthetic protein FlhB [Ketogulonicigenium vulgare WSH-001]ALJ81885.1 flagellar biosynthesis protein FlhB [Ketogulonicigenium vulgare]ANW34534.1 flagellar biosynthesis protein FlhB [Ketogulonicigenium vulgare]AOZ55535.1 flagellar biosynthetic protein FlhB [Ketogulonicigenium vulgare]